MFGKFLDISSMAYLVEDLILRGTDTDSIMDILYPEADTQQTVVEYGERILDTLSSQNDQAILRDLGEAISLSKTAANKLEEFPDLRDKEGVVDDAYQGLINVIQQANLVMQDPNAGPEAVEVAVNALAFATTTQLAVAEVLQTGEVEHGGYRRDATQTALEEVADLLGRSQDSYKESLDTEVTTRLEHEPFWSWSKFSIQWPEYQYFEIDTKADNISILHAASEVLGKGFIMVDENTIKIATGEYNSWHNRAADQSIADRLSAAIDENASSHMSQATDFADQLASITGGIMEIADPSSSETILNGTESDDYLSFHMLEEAIDVTINGGGGDDYLVGGAGNDEINGGAGNDKLKGGAGDDVLNGGDGIDELTGGEGNDVLNGGRGMDVLIGGTGDDVLDGGAGHDILTGGEGADSFHVAVSGTSDLITDFISGEDTIVLNDYYQRDGVSAQNGFVDASGARSLSEAEAMRDANDFLMLFDDTLYVYHEIDAPHGGTAEFEYAAVNLVGDTALTGSDIVFV